MFWFQFYFARTFTYYFIIMQKNPTEKVPITIFSNFNRFKQARRDFT